MQPTYLFYDLETSGLNKSFDQVMQFAAIRTDLEFNELAQYNILVKLKPDVVPAPMAMLTHQISLEELLSGFCEFNAIEKIHQIMNEPGTISVGYNTLNFDDEFLRFSFYRNLLPPYTHQYANQCGRMDLYPMAIMYYLFKRDVIVWPEINGKKSMRLEHINSANDFVDGVAHDALVDVKITLELAKRFQAEREMWDYLCGYFSKETDLTRIKNLSTGFVSHDVEHKQAIMIKGSCGAEKFYQCPVLSLGQHYHYKNQTLWLRLDTLDLMSTTMDSIPETTWVERKKTGEPGLLLPTNARFMQYLSKERLAFMEENKKWLQHHEDILQEIIRYYCDYQYPKIPNLDVDAALYQNGFISREEEALCEEFHRVSVKEKVNMLDLFRNPNLKQLAIRLIGRNYPDCLSGHYLTEFEEYLQQVNPNNPLNALVDFRGEKKLVPEVALQEIQKLRLEELTDKQLTLLQALENYLKTYFQSV